MEETLREKDDVIANMQAQVSDLRAEFVAVKSHAHSRYDDMDENFNAVNVSLDAGIGGEPDSPASAAVLRRRVQALEVCLKMFHCFIV